MTGEGEKRESTHGLEKIEDKILMLLDMNK